MKHSMTERLVDELRDVVENVEQLLRASADGSGEKIVHARQRAERSLNQARKRLHAAQRRMLGRTRSAMRTTDWYVHAHPWSSIAAAAGVGFLIGLLTTRR